MTRDEAREYFKNAGLSYADLNEEDIQKLLEILSEELTLYYKNGGEHAQQMAMKVRKPRIIDIKCLKRTGLQYAFLKIDGGYFERREGISFNKNGFIGFGGEFSDVNVQPILKAFCRWCDTFQKPQMGEGSGL